jgi:ASC-1-like (ASCH) protein
MIRFERKDRISFDKIKSGEKPIETRAATVKYQAVTLGDELVFSCAGELFSRAVVKIHRWESVEEMAKEAPLRKVIPWADSLDEAKAVFASFPGYEEKIQEFGILGFELA